jgi:chromosome segregation ATPase
LRKSLAGQLDILEQRLARQQEARGKLAFLEAEIARIQEQVELIREQAMLSMDATAVSERIDQVAATLGGTTQWIQEQQKLYGQVEDLVSDTPPMLVPAVKESQ